MTKIIRSDELKQKKSNQLNGFTNCILFTKKQQQQKKPNISMKCNGTMELYQRYIK